MKIRKYLSIYLSYFVQYWKSRLEYRSDFLISGTGQLINTVVQLGFLTLIFTQVESIRGWSFNEMLFLAGFSGSVVFTHNFFLFNIYRLGEEYVVTGDLDRFLLRPLSPLFQIYADSVHDNNLPKLIANLALVVYAGTQLGLVMTPVKWFYALFTFVSGVMTVASIYLLFSSTSFWTGTSKSAIWLIFRLSDFRRYPFGIFGLIIQVALVTVVPLAFASYFPVSYILSKPGYETAKLFSLVSGPVLFAVAWLLWRKGLSEYSSTGS